MKILNMVEGCGTHLHVNMCSTHGTLVPCACQSTIESGSSGDVVLWLFVETIQRRIAATTDDNAAAFCGIFQHFPNLQPTHGNWYSFCSIPGISILKGVALVRVL